MRKGKNKQLNKNAKKMSDLKLDKNTFKPDKSAKELFDWEEVISRFDRPLSSEDFKYYKRCPKCERRSTNLFWVKVKSPELSWKMKAGSSGSLSICPECNIQIQFIRTGWS